MMNSYLSELNDVENDIAFPLIIIFCIFSGQASAWKTRNEKGKYSASFAKGEKRISVVETNGSCPQKGISLRGRRTRSTGLDTID